LLPRAFGGKGGLNRGPDPFKARRYSDLKERLRAMSEKTFVAVAKLDDLPAGTKIVADADGIEIVLCNTRDTIFAVQNLCSHAHEKLDCGKMKNGWISCPVHGARFDLETGEPMNPPATMAIKTYEVRVTGDTIEVAV
jgi:3-phenylpropionate/trans-cinnamate dioxygenase ferredoxin subunit